MTDSTHEIQLKIDPSSIGQVIHRETKELSWKGIVEVYWDDAVLPLYVKARTDEREKPGDDQKWSHILTHAAAGMAKSRRLRAFRENDVSYFVTDATGDETVVTVGVPEDYFQELVADQRSDAEFRTHFEQAVKVLRSAIGAQADDAAFHALQQLLEAGYVGHNYSWYREKMSRIRHILNPAKPRKNSRRGDSQQQVSDLLCMFRPPDAWIQRPLIG